MPDFITEYKKKYKLLTVLPDVPVDELNDLYTRARIAIVPLLSGAGVKGKVIEAFAKGVPVAGTDVAFEGMPKTEGFLYKGHNSAQALTEEILKLYNDRSYWDKLAAFGKEYVLKNFSRENMREVFKSVIG
jgi:glycosyltransferase involved in cell wall biosynthesis